MNTISRDSACPVENSSSGGGRADSSSSSPIVTFFESKRAFWGLIAILIVVQWLMFRNYVEREIAWGYPKNHDQIGYLERAYRAYDDVLRSRSLRPIASMVAENSATGVMLHTQAVLLFLVFGASRLTALSLNFFYFALAQVVFAGTVRRFTGRSSLALLSLAVLLAAKSPFFWAGGLDDFRMDSIAFSLYCIVTTLVIRSDTFKSRNWSIVVGCAAAMLVLFRFLTIVYLAIGAFAFFAFVGVMFLIKRHDPAVRRDSFARFRGMAIATGIIFAVALPAFLHNREQITNYYVVGHVTGPEKAIREREMGIFNTWDMLTFYPKSILTDHLGNRCLRLGGVVLAVGALYFFTKSRGRAGHELPELSGIHAAIFLAASVAVPFAILTANVSKSPVVANIMVPGVTWFAVLGMIALYRARRNVRIEGRYVKYATTGVTAFAICIVVFYQAIAFNSRGPLSSEHRDSQQISDLYEVLGQRIALSPTKNAVISVDQNVDFTGAPIATILHYERHRVLVTTERRLASIFAPTWEKVKSDIDVSDFMLFTESDARSLRTSPFPFDNTMKEFRPRVRELCEQQFEKIGTYDIRGCTMVLYARPTLRLIGESAGWILSDGMLLEGYASALQKFPLIQLDGKMPPGIYKAVPKVEALVTIDGEKPVPVPATMSVEGPNYHIEIDTHALDLASKERVSCRILFDSHFVPSKLPKEFGASSDTRELVVMSPESSRIVAVGKRR